MKNLRLITMLAFVLILTIGNTQADQLNNIASKYDSFFENLNTSYGVLTNRNGQKSFASIGSLDLNENSVFNIGSATKKITAILILQEIEKGNLSLSDSIGKFLSPIDNVDGSLTIEALLRHRSGLGEFAGRNFEAMFFAQSDSVYSTGFLEKIPPSNPENVGKHNYCNTNYMLLGHILEQVTDMSYFDLLRKRIFEPCEMTNSYAYVSRSIENLVHPTHNGQDVYDKIDHRFFADYAYAAGSIASSLEDMSRFYDHLFDQNTLLTKTSLATLLDFDDADYGLGMMTMEIDSVKYYGHGGTNIGYSFREYYNPQNGDLMVCFSNAYKIPFHKLLRDEILQNTNHIKFNDRIVRDYKSSVGTYFFKEMGMELVIKSNESNMTLEVQGMNLLLVSHEYNKLYAPQFGIELQIDSDDNDKITFRQNGMEAVINRVIKSETSPKQ